MPLILVVGFGEDSGKTTLAASLAAALSSEGFRVQPFKPVGATRVWLHPQVLSESRSRGFLVTWDGYVLSRAVEGSGGPETVNPVAGLVAPVDPFTGRRYSEALVALRVSGCSGRRVHLYEARTLDSLPPTLSGALRGVLPRLRPEPAPVKPGGLGGVVESLGVEAADSCLARLLGEADVVVAESNSDVAAPTPLTARPDLVVAVAPGRAAVYRGDRWSLALQLLASGRPHAAVVGEVARLVEPLRLVDLPLTGDALEGLPPDSLEPIVEEVKALRARREGGASG